MVVAVAMVVVVTIMVVATTMVVVMEEEVAIKEEVDIKEDHHLKTQIMELMVEATKTITIHNRERRMTETVARHV